MCGRFTQKLTWRQIHDLYSLKGPSLPLNLQRRHNGAPAQDFPACRLDEDGNRAIAQVRCGLVPAWSKDSRMSTHRINARAVTVHTKPLFGDAFRSRRCLVPANGWFEWQRTGHGSSLSSWRSRMDRRCRSPRCGSTGARTENPWSPSPSSHSSLPAPWPTSTIGNRRLSTPTGSTIGSIRRRRSRGSLSWCVNPVPSLREAPRQYQGE